MTTKILHALKPKNLSEWDRWPVRSNLAREAYDVGRWYHRRTSIQVVSAIEVVREEGREQRPEYHISISHADMRTGVVSRVNSNDARAILAMFDVSGWLEDNHAPSGKARNFWRPIAEPAVGVPCVCVDDEPAIVEDKGDYIWRGVTK